jgi:hypothetical protein
MMRCRPAVTWTLPAAALSLLPAVVAAAEAPLRFAALSPGAFVVHRQTVPVRIVLIGFGDEVDDDAVLAGLPATYKPVVRYPRFYGLQGRDLGLEYALGPRVERRGAAFTRRFFAFLRGAGTPGPLTSFQQAYNDQRRNVLDVTGPVLYVDAPKVEKWLADNDTGGERAYTVYFVNWFGRPGFQFHVYTKTDEPDPDTGYNFGAARGSRKMVAWGGTHSRSWFYDFSAGPESWGGSYDVDDADLDGDGVADERVPPIWEYGPGAYRARERLAADMARLARFVAIDLLFTTSPLYDPLLTAPEPGGRKVAHVTMLEDDVGTSGLDWFRRQVVERAWRAFQPYYRWAVGLSASPMDAGAKDALEIFVGNRAAEGCGKREFGTSDAELYCYLRDNAPAYVPAYEPRDAVGGILSYSTTAEGLGGVFGLLGFADDNWTDGGQTYQFILGSAAYRELGYGFSTTVIHEFGHHIGMSHPHDGYDSEKDLDFGPIGDTFYAWLGDESDTVMHYLAVSNGFGRHNQDNMYRWETAGYLNWANALAGDVLARDESRRALPALQAADLLARQARDAFDDWRYLEAARNARAAYAVLKEAADSLGVASRWLEDSRRLAAMAPGPKKDGCRPRYPTEQRP